jgi:hypothetical protein
VRGGEMEDGGLPGMAGWVPGVIPGLVPGTTGVLLGLVPGAGVGAGWPPEGLVWESSNEAARQSGSSISVPMEHVNSKGT